MGKDILDNLGEHFVKGLHRTAAGAGAILAEHVKGELDGIVDALAGGSEEKAEKAPMKRIKAAPVCTCKPTSAETPDGDVMLIHAKACPVR